MDKILKVFFRFISKNRGEIEAKLNSSKELSENFTSKIKLEYEHDPKLVGGLIIQIGSVMIDTSIKNRLKQLEISMLEA